MLQAFSDKSEYWRNTVEHLTWWIILRGTWTSEPRFTVLVWTKMVNWHPWKNAASVAKTYCCQFFPFFVHFIVLSCSLWIWSFPLSFLPSIPLSLSLSPFLHICLPLSPSSSVIPQSVLCISILPPLCASGQTSWALVYPLILPPQRSLAGLRHKHSSPPRQEVISQNLIRTPSLCLSLCLLLLLLPSVNVTSSQSQTSTYAGVVITHCWLFKASLHMVRYR